MKQFAGIIAAVLVVCACDAVAQEKSVGDRQAHDTQSSVSSVIHAPRTEEVTGEGDNDVRVRGPYPYVWIEPNGSALTRGWSSAWFQMNVATNEAPDGDYFGFFLHDTSGSTKQFFFNRNVILKDTSRLGVGTLGTLPETDLEVTKNDATSVSGLFRNLNTSGAAVVQMKSGDGTTSARKAYSQYTSSETTSRSWSVGMMGGDGEFRIKDGTNTDRMTISVPQNGNATITFNGTVEGGIIHAKYQDIAEWVTAPQPLSPGTVVIASPDRVNEVIASTTPYDTSVIGVVSEQPGIVLGQGSSSKVRVATMGRVRVNVQADRGPIRIGDLLVTGDKTGMAMKSVAAEVGGGKFHRVGTILGKALEPLPSGTGQILVLLTLQ